LSIREKDSRLAGLSVAGDLTSLLRSYLIEKRISSPALANRLITQRRLTFAEWWSLLDTLQEKLPQSAVGTELAERVSAEHLGVIGYLTLSCRTVLEAFQHFERFQRLLYDGPRARLELRGGLAGLIWDRDYGASSQLSDQVILGGLVTFLRRMTGTTDLRLSRTDVIWDELPDREAYLQHTGGELVCSSAENAVWFDPAYLAMPLTGHDDSALLELQHTASRALDTLPDHGQFVAGVRRMMVDLLPLGKATQYEIASQLAMSERTLLRKLRAEGTGFRDLLAEVRIELAQAYLSDPHLTLSEIALLLGYSEQAPFNRAFRKSMGLTPGQWKRNRR